MIPHHTARPNRQIRLTGRQVMIIALGWPWKSGIRGPQASWKLLAKTILRLSISGATVCSGALPSVDSLSVSFTCSAVLLEAAVSVDLADARCTGCFTCTLFAWPLNCDINMFCSQLPTVAFSNCVTAKSASTRASSYLPNDRAPRLWCHAASDRLPRS